MTAAFARVLLVEDNPGDARLLRQRLEETASARFEVTHVQRLGDGLQRLQQGAYDVVLLDLGLPDSHGLETLDQVRAQATGLPIVVLTGFQDEALAVEAVKGGAQDYLPKDHLDSNVLVRSIRHAIERKRAEEDLRRARDEAIKATRAKSEFLANMSHEIRTPMNAILGMADLLSETQLTVEQQRYVQVLTRAGDTLMTLINDILDLSKVEAGQLDLEKISFNLRELVEGTASILAVRARDKDLEVTTHLSPDVPTDLVGDPLRLRQVLTNLLGNAVKFTEQGKVVLHVENGPRADQPGSILFRISDTGVGIPEDRLESIFDTFTQADSSTTREYGGTGLGLAISTRLVEMMGGRIWVESKVGEGSTFYFTAQLEAPAEPSRHKPQPATSIEGLKTQIVADNGTKEEAPPPLESPDAPEDKHALRILLVEDNEDNRFQVVSYLREIVCELDVAEDGEAGVRKFKQGTYDLVLMDIQMPVMDGYTATREIRRWESMNGMKPTPIIALTACALKKEEEESLEAGCTVHISKPVKKAPFLQAIHEYTHGVTA